MAQFTVNAARFDPYKNFKFRVKWDGRYVAGVSKVGALKRTTEVVEHRENPVRARAWTPAWPTHADRGKHRKHHRRVARLSRGGQDDQRPGACVDRYLRLGPQTSAGLTQNVIARFFPAAPRILVIRLRPSVTSRAVGESSNGFSPRIWRSRALSRLWSASTTLFWRIARRRAARPIRVRRSPAGRPVPDRSPRPAGRLA